MAKKNKIHEVKDSMMQQSLTHRAMNHAFFAQIDSRRRQEVAEGGMLNEDHTAMANLPTEAIHTEYPRSLRRNGLGFPDVREFVRGYHSIDDDYELE